MARLARTNFEDVARPARRSFEDVASGTFVFAEVEGLGRSRMPKWFWKCGRTVIYKGSWSWERGRR
eukprot:3257521-Pyramimonas_sp.AAC.1